MSMIIDANCCAAALRKNPDADFSPLLVALFKGKAKLVFGGKLKIEYQQVHAIWRTLKLLDQAGRAQLIDDNEVNEEEKIVSEKFLLVSDDPHIIALARVSGARLLCSRDQNLHIDFSNPVIINSPRGSVYQNASHAHLIRKCG